MNAQFYLPVEIDLKLQLVGLCFCCKNLKNFLESEAINAN